jgi:hypothetical protein
MEWKTGFEPATSGTTIQRSNQLSYIHHLLIWDCKFKDFFDLVNIPVRFFPLYQNFSGNYPIDINTIE